VAIIVALAAGFGASVARADGDPASDVLVTESVFVPWDAGISPAQEARLEGVLAAATRAGFPIRVAVIASTTDLGTVTPLWNDPRAYALYLGTELSLVYKGQVLVVMPDGIGVYPGARRPSEAEVAAAATLPAPGRRLVSAAEAAVQRLAASAGHPISPSSVNVSVPRTPARSHLVSWIALIAGLLLIALAWAASVAARPLRWRREVSPS